MTMFNRRVTGMQGEVNIKKPFDLSLKLGSGFVQQQVADSLNQVREALNIFGVDLSTSVKQKCILKKVSDSELTRKYIMGYQNTTVSGDYSFSTIDENTNTINCTIRINNNITNPQSLHEMIVHEVGHAAVRQATEGIPLLVTFTEGIPQYMVIYKSPESIQSYCQELKQEVINNTLSLDWDKMLTFNKVYTLGSILTKFFEDNNPTLIGGYVICVRDSKQAFQRCVDNLDNCSRNNSPLCYNTYTICRNHKIEYKICNEVYQQCMKPHDDHCTAIYKVCIELMNKQCLEPARKFYNNGEGFKKFIYNNGQTKTFSQSQNPDRPLRDEPYNIKFKERSAYKHPQSYTKYVPIDNKISKSITKPYTKKISVTSSNIQPPSAIKEPLTTKSPIKTMSAKDANPNPVTVICKSVTKDCEFSDYPLQDPNIGVPLIIAKEGDITKRVCDKDANMAPWLNGVKKQFGFQKPPLPKTLLQGIEERCPPIKNSDFIFDPKLDDQLLQMKYGVIPNKGRPAILNHQGNDDITASYHSWPDLPPLLSKPTVASTPAAADTAMLTILLPILLPLGLLLIVGWVGYVICSRYSTKQKPIELVIEKSGNITQMKDEKQVATNPYKQNSKIYSRVNNNIIDEESNSNGITDLTGREQKQVGNGIKNILNDVTDNMSTNHNARDTQDKKITLQALLEAAGLNAQGAQSNPDHQDNQDSRREYNHVADVTDDTSSLGEVPAHGYDAS
ncbi:hypothetical protein [Candidatus Tisiphia endosymbiont of Nemotelus uliginosus]|uniref:hypothetical protein n=1 Tax=Candidatus Tisiphia endosymbiont of Nemotelus uliginosus TaxID=3077926 RepID=UPI0035C8AB9C